MPDSNSFTRSQPWVQRIGSSSRAAAKERKNYAFISPFGSGVGI